MATSGYRISLESARKTISNKDWERLFRRDSRNKCSVTYQIEGLYWHSSLQCEARSGSKWVGAGTGTYWDGSQPSWSACSHSDMMFDFNQFQPVRFAAHAVLGSFLFRRKRYQVWCRAREDIQSHILSCVEVVFTISLKLSFWLAKSRTGVY